jgi:hypothetical protein
MGEGAQRGQTRQAEQEALQIAPRAQTADEPVFQIALDGFVGLSSARKRSASDVGVSRMIAF